MRFWVIAAAACLFALGVRPAQAQQIKLEFKDGRVSLNAQNATLRAILGEWARLGGATIVNGDRVTGAPVTLELTAVPERQALDTLLRSVAAYMLAPRRAGTAGASTFDRILILPTSAAPRNPPPATAPVAATRPVRPPVLANSNVPTEADGGDDNGAPADLAPQPRVRPPQPLAGNGVVVPGESEAGANEPVIVGGTPPSPGNPFGIPAGSSARPGTIAAPQPQPAPNQR